MFVEALPWLIGQPYLKYKVPGMRQGILSKYTAGALAVQRKGLWRKKVSHQVEDGVEEMVLIIHQVLP